MRLTNAIPTIFQCVETNLKGFTALALPLAALYQQKSSASHTDHGQPCFVQLGLVCETLVVLIFQYIFHSNVPSIHS